MRNRSASQAMRALVDSSAYFALLDRDDSYHSQALAIQNRLIVERWRLFTTSFILAEAHALLLNRLSQQMATAFLRDLEQGTTTLVWVTRADVQRAKEIIYQYDDKDFSFTDATSFAIMERLSIPQAFTFDQHFTQYGLTVLTAS